LIGDGINPIKLFMQSMGPQALPASQRNVLRLVAPAVLDSPYGPVLRQAAADHAALVVQVAQLSEVDRKAIPDVIPTADKLVDQIATLAGALHRLDDTPSDGGGEYQQKFAEQRAAFKAQLDRAAIALQTLLLDVTRLRVGGLQGAVGSVTSATQEAHALSREIGYVLGAAEELRNNDRR
jgi:serine/threonine-protein kinase